MNSWTGGETEWIEVSFEGLAAPIRLERPSQPDRLLTDPGVVRLNREHDYMPYWAYLWPGAFLLGAALARESWAPGTRAIELGCGLGLAGLVGLAVGLDVCSTDYDEAPLEFVRRSARANGFGPARHSTARLDWKAPGDRCFPLILAADVTYEQKLVPLVAHAIDALLEPDGEAIVAGPARAAGEAFPAELRARGLRVESVGASATDDAGRPVRGTIQRIRRKRRA